MGQINNAIDILLPFAMKIMHICFKIIIMTITTNNKRKQRNHFIAILSLY